MKYNRRSEQDVLVNLFSYFLNQALFMLLLKPGDNYGNNNYTANYRTA